MARTKGSKNKKPVELKLEDVLWNCRDILRGKASMATQRDMILTLVFLKFIGEKFYRHREKIKSDMAARNLPADRFIENPPSISATACSICRKSVAGKCFSRLTAPDYRSPSI